MEEGRSAERTRHSTRHSNGIDIEEREDDVAKQLSIDYGVLISTNLNSLLMRRRKGST